MIARASDAGWPRSAAVIGLGLVGGSLARELAARGTRVVGWDASACAVHAALGDGVLAGAAPPPFHAVEGVDVVVLAVPVTAAPGLLEQLAPRLARVPLVTDVGSTKRAVVAAAERLGLGERFVGAHPMAGDHRAGWAASRLALFAGARVHLTPTPRTGADALARAEALWSALGAEVARADPMEHDRRLAWASHLPHTAAAALGLTMACAGTTPDELGPGGRDATRLAASDPDLWTAVALENADLLAPAVAELERHLREWREAMERGDARALRELFARSRAWKAGA